MRADAKVADGDKLLAALMRMNAAATADAALAERQRPMVYPEWLSLHAAAYTGYFEQRFPDFVKRRTAPKSVLVSQNARRFNRSGLGAWCAAGTRSASSPKGDPGAVRR